MIADIASGKTATADVCFLIALIVFALAVVVAFIETIKLPLYQILIGIGLGLVALGWLVL